MGVAGGRGDQRQRAALQGQATDKRWHRGPRLRQPPVGSLLRRAWRPLSSASISTSPSSPHCTKAVVLQRFGFEHEELDAALEGTDVAVILTAHPGVDYADVCRRVGQVVDLRGVTRGIGSANLSRL